jgi:hypothetical protein
LGLGIFSPFNELPVTLAILTGFTGISPTTILSLTAFLRTVSRGAELFMALLSQIKNEKQRKSRVAFKV